MKPPEPSRFQGNAEEEAARRLKAEGYNELPRHGYWTAPAIVLEVLRDLTSPGVLVI